MNKLIRRNDFNKLFLEKERIGKLSQIRELIFGAQDGLLGTLALIATISGAVKDTHIIILTGLSACVAGAISMGTGTYLASKSELDLYESEIRKAEYAIKKHRQEKKDEMALILEEEALSKKDAQLVTDTLSKSRESFLNTILQKEMGIEPEPESNPLRDAYYAAGSFILTALVPVIPYFLLSGPLALIVSTISTIAGLFILGIYKGTITATPYFKSGLEIAIIGAFSSAGGYLIGVLFRSFVT